MSSIQAKLFGLTCALAVVLVGFLVTYFPARRLASARQTMDDKARTYARLVSTQVEPAVAFDDRETVREVFAALELDSDVRSLALYKADGELLYVAGEASSAAPPLASTREVVVERLPGVIRATSHVVAREGPTGTLVLELAEDRLETERARIQRVAAGVGALSLAFAMLGAWVIGRSLARRLRAIAAATRAVAEGDLSVAPIEDRSRDEIGQLARSFATMLAYIRELVAQIRAASEKETERLELLVRQRTRELESSMERYKTLVESTNAVPWELEPGAVRFVYVSPQSKRILGIDPSQLLRGKGLCELVHADDLERVTAELAQLARSREAAGLEIEHRAIGSFGRVTEVRSIVGTSGAAEGVSPRLHGITLDVTRQRKLESELRQAQKLECVGRLASGVAHEVNTPVQFVSDSVHFVRDAIEDLFGFIAKLVRVQRSVLDGAPSHEAALEAAAAGDTLDFAYLHEFVPKALDRALDGLLRVTSIVRSMKEFAHPDQRQMSSADLNQAIESTLVIARSEYKYVADLETDFGALPPVDCHLGAINQVVLNVVVNAAHAVGDAVEGTGRRGRITVRTRQEGADAVISIADTGGGIPAHVRDHVFDPFFTTKEVGVGTGQGLAIARSIVVDRHHGQLTFETEVGKGTTFFIRLPLQAALERRAA